MKCALIASKGSSQWGFRAARAAFPARAPFRLASIPLLGEGKGTGLLREARRLISIPLAYSLRCAIWACRGQLWLPANKAPFIARAGFLPAARPQMGCAGTPSRDPGARPGRARTGPDSGGRLSPGPPRLLFRQTLQWGSAEPRFRAGDQRTLSLFSVEILSLLTARSEPSCQFPRPFPPPLSPPPAPPPLPLGMVRPKVPRVVRGLCFSSAASEIPTKGSLPDFCVSSIQRLERSYPLVVTSTSLQTFSVNFFSELKHSSRLKFGTMASQQRPLFLLPRLTPGKKENRKENALVHYPCLQLWSTFPLSHTLDQQQVNATESSNVK